MTWRSSDILSAILLAAGTAAKGSAEMPLSGVQLSPLSQGGKHRCVLELGAGTGVLATTLASAGWRGIIATDGEPGVVKNLKYNVQANRLGHAVRCLRWDWDSPPPKGLNLSDVDLCIGSDLVYYDRAHTNLADVLRSVLTARVPGDLRLQAQVLLLVCLRQVDRDEGGYVVHRASSEGYTGTSIQRFFEQELSDHGLSAHGHPIPDEALHSIDADARGAYRLYEVQLAQPTACAL